MSESDNYEFKHLKEFTYRYTPIREIGKGTFSTVYLAFDKKTEEKVAIKLITRTSSPKRVFEELEFLQLLKGRNNIVELLDCQRYEDQVIAVFNHFESIDFKDFLGILTLVDVRYYMYSLLLALEYVHRNGIIHRDIKPSNFLYSNITNRGILIDFGLAERGSHEKFKDSESIQAKKRPSLVFFNNSGRRTINTPGIRVNDGREAMRAPRAGTRGFRAPEVLFKVKNQTNKIDIWSCGIIFLSMITREYPIFDSMDDLDAVGELACIYGKVEMKKTADHYNRVINTNLSTVPIERIPFEEIVARADGICIGHSGYDLLYSMLELRDDKRISAFEALKHPFFKDV